MSYTPRTFAAFPSHSKETSTSEKPMHILTRRERLCGESGSTREQHCQLFKLVFLATLPGVILIVQNAVNLTTNLKTWRANSDVKENIGFSLELSKVIHAIQTERGTTALYVSSDGDPFVKSRLNLLYTETDIAINSLSKWTSNGKLDYFHSKDAFHDEIRTYRARLNPRNITFKKVIDFYTIQNAVFIKMIGQSINMEKPFSFWTELAAYQMLIFSKEQAGIERGLGSTYYARGQFPIEDLLWYKDKHVLGKTFLEDCQAYSVFAKSSIDQMYTDTLLAKDIDVMRDTIINNSLSIPSVVSGAIWFDNMTAYLNILKIVQDKIANKIVQQADFENKDLEDKFTLSAIELAVAIVMVPIIVVLVRNIIRRIHKFSAELKVKTRELEEERQRTEELLYQLLPRTVAKKLMQEGNALPEAYHSATIMFTDVVGFTTISSQSTPMQVINMLNKLYMTIDGRLENFDVYKVETIGDGYMVSSGLPSRNGDRHVEEIAKLALDLLKTLDAMEVPHLRNEKLRLRAGFNTGPCVAGVVGVKMPRYCVFGDTVNTASRMESTGLPKKIQMTETSAAKLRLRYGFLITERGTVDVKGKGLMRTFWLDGYKPPKNIGTTEPTSQSLERNNSITKVVKFTQEQIGRNSVQSHGQTENNSRLNSTEPLDYALIEVQEQPKPSTC